jgi:hypothetical protein
MSIQTDRLETARACMAKVSNAMEYPPDLRTEARRIQHAIENLKEIAIEHERAISPEKP